MKNTLAILIVVLCPNFLFAQNGPAKATNLFTEEDWNKLSQHAKDSISKNLFETYKAGSASSNLTAEEEANKTIQDALANIHATTRLSFSNYPNVRFTADVAKLKNVRVYLHPLKNA